MAGENDSKGNGRSGRKRGILGIFLSILVLIFGLTFGTVLLLEIRNLKTEVGDLSRQIGELSGYIETYSESLNTLCEDMPTGEQETQEEDFTSSIEEVENKILWQEEEQSAKAWDSSVGIRKVYLTFDDGPSNNTDKILDILNEYGVKATFFVVGKDGYNEQYQRIVNEGHTLGIHSFSHKYREIYQSLDSYKYDLNKLHDYLYEITGVDSKIVRFPGGSSNKTSKVNMQVLIDYLAQEGMVYYDWNVSSGDASAAYISANQITNNVLNNVWKYDSVVVLMHDAPGKSSTVEALPGIIEKILEADNTVLLSISEDTVPIQHIEQNVNKVEIGGE